MSRPNGALPSTASALPPPPLGHNSRFTVDWVPTDTLKLEEDSPRRFSRRDENAARKVIARFGFFSRW